MKNLLFIGLVVVLGIGAAFLSSSFSDNAPVSPAAANPNVTFIPNSSEPQGAVNQSDTIVASAVSANPCVKEKASNFSCYENYYENLVKEKGTAAAFVDLKAVYPQNEYVRSQCHPLTHVLGRVSADTFKTVSEAYAQGDSFCWSGYYHGVLESVIAKIGLDNLPKQMDSICAKIEGKERYSFDYYNCVHGLGHGVMAVNDNELFEALAMCDNLTGNWEQLSCGSGAFMENVIVDGLNHKTNYLDPKRPLFPCDESPVKYKMTCYLMQTSYMLKINGGDFEKTFEWCAQAEAGYQETCYQSLGRDASGRSLSQVAPTKAICLMGRNQIQQSHCVVGAVKDVISYFHSDVQAKAFCNSFEDALLVSLCLDTAKSYYTLF